MRNILVTGGAGFIGSHVVERLLSDGFTVTAVDNFDPFYAPRIKRRSIEAHLAHPAYKLLELDICDYDKLHRELNEPYCAIVHLAAKAGVRPSIQNPMLYQSVNVQGTQNLLELAKERGIELVVFASSSSVYGVNPNRPWREDDHVLLPISPYASTKVSSELLGHVYSHLYDIRFIALRLFTVYGPRQRPDLAIHKFARLMLENRPIPVYGDGSSRRDYTYIDDIVRGIRAAIDYRKSRYEVINLGNNTTVSLAELIETLESVLGTEAKREFLPEQPGDVSQTYADTTKSKELLGFRPKTELSSGVRTFAEWLLRDVAAA